MGKIEGAARVKVLNRDKEMSHGLPRRHAAFT